MDPRNAIVVLERARASKIQELAHVTDDMRGAKLRFENSPTKQDQNVHGRTHRALLKRRTIIEAQITDLNASINAAKRQLSEEIRNARNEE